MTNERQILQHLTLILQYITNDLLFLEHPYLTPSNVSYIPC